MFKGPLESFLSSSLASAPPSRRSATAFIQETCRGGMLGRCPRSSLNRTTSKTELRTPRDEIVHFPSSESEKPLLQPPHQIVIGFDLGSDGSKSSHLPPAACESPRSVLEPHSVCFRSHPHQSVQRPPHSPLSALGSLLAGNRGNIPCAEGAALCLKSAFKAEEAVADVKAQHNSSGRGFVAGDVDVVDAYSALSRRERGASDHCKAKKQGDLLTFSSIICAEVGENQPWKHSPSTHATRIKCLYPKTVLCCDEEDEDNNGAAVDADGGDEVDVLPVSIFSTASPVANYFRHEIPEADFLSRCYLCRRRLLLGKDIYMYRGDRAFCSKECRYKQIVADERKERCLAVTTCVPGASSHHQSFQRTNQAAVA